MTMSVFEDFPGLENLEKNSRTFKDPQGPCAAIAATHVKVFKLRFEYLYTYSPKCGDFAEKSR